MAKFSRFTAIEVATSMANDAFKGRESSVRKQIKEVCDKIAKEQIPQEVLDICAKWKEHISVVSNLSVACLDNRGKTRCWVTSAISFGVPAGHDSFDVVGEDSDKLYTLNEELRQLRSRKNTLQNNIENVLLDLGTTKRVEAEFAIAVPYFAKFAEPDSSEKNSKCEALKKLIEEEREKGRSADLLI